VTKEELMIKQPPLPPPRKVTNEELLEEQPPSPPSPPSCRPRVGAEIEVCCCKRNPPFKNALTPCTTPQQMH
jgi:hypothetical protein